ncbi:MAG TPA: hypothetical protein VIE64_06925 [Solirubrobacterales bacterium]|jgi:hypothetical protein
MSSPPPSATTFVSHGTLTGVLHERNLGPEPSKRDDARQGPPTSNGSPELDTQTYEALYYRARLVLGSSLPRPPRT